MSLQYAGKPKKCTKPSLFLLGQVSLLLITLLHLSTRSESGSGIVFFKKNSSSHELKLCINTELMNY